MPVFQLLAERFLGPEYAPERVAEATGVSAATIRRIAAELAHAAFKEEITLDIPWTDWFGRRHDKMIGRPVGMHAMRGISAHANGFHTCRMLHVLQILLGSIDCPGGFRYKAPYPKLSPPFLKPRGKPGDVQPGKPLPGPHLGFPTGPEDLLVDAAGTPQRIDKAFSWDAPLSAHGLMHMVIANAAKGDPYPIDVLFLYMANMGWNSSMNLPATLEHLTEKDPDTGDYKIPRIIYSDAYFSETVPYADLILPDTTYLERWDCISLLDRPISEADGPADAIRQPIMAPDRDVRPFQDVLLELGARLKLPGMTKEDGTAKFPGGYPDYIVNHERRPGIGPLAGWRGKNGGDFGRGEVNPRQLEQYIANGCFHIHHLPEHMRYFQHVNRDYIEWALDKGFRLTPTPAIFQLYSEPMQKMRLAARGYGAVVPPEQHRARIETYFDPLPFWYAPFEDAASGEAEFPMHAITQRPMAMYHSWGSQNAWLRQIHGANRLYMSRARAKQLGIEDDDWVWITSRIGRVKAQVKLMEGVNADTVWTWNAIGKRSGTWGLDPDAPEATRGFLLNHLIAELLPEQVGGYRYSNSDPVTGQAAWYDLRVRVEKASRLRAAGDLAALRAAARSARRRHGVRPLARALAGRAQRRGKGSDPVWSAEMTALPATTAKKLGLVIDLDTCVGCQACATSAARSGTPAATPPRSPTRSPTAPIRTAPGSTACTATRWARAPSGRTVHFPRSCLHCEEPACVTVCPTGASFKRAEDGIVLVDPDTCIGCKLCSWACPYGAREYDYGDGVMKKCTLCVDRIYNDHLPEEDRIPACVRACPTGARHFGDLGDPASAVSQLVAERGGYDLLPEIGYKPVNKYLPPRARRDGRSAPAGTRPRPSPPAAATGAAADKLFAWVDRILSR